MKDTTLIAFKTMMNVIYNRPVNFKNMSGDQVFELVNLAERYDLKELKAKLKLELETMSLSKESVVEVTKAALKFHHLEEASQAVLYSCAKTLTRELETKESVVQFCAIYSGTDEEEIVMKLMSVMYDLQPLCSNCQEKPCKSGTPITSMKQVRVGTVLAPNSDCISLRKWNMEQRGEIVVKSIDNRDEEMHTMIVEEGNGAVKYSMTCCYWIIDEGIPMFRFFCRK